MITPFEERWRRKHLIGRLERVCEQLDLPGKTDVPELTFWWDEAKALVRAFSGSSPELIADMVVNQISGGNDESLAIVDAVSDSWTMFVVFNMGKSGRKTFQGASEKLRKRLLSIAERMDKAHGVAGVPYAMRREMSEFLKHVIQSEMAKLGPNPASSWLIPETFALA